MVKFTYMIERDLDEEAVRLTAYFLWEQEGRPDLNPEHFWSRAVELHSRAKACDLELEAGVEALNDCSAGIGKDGAVCPS
jgi:hypothetical protein